MDKQEKLKHRCGDPASNWPCSNRCMGAMLLRVRKSEREKQAASSSAAQEGSGE